MKTDVEDGKSKIGSFSHFKGNIIFKKKKYKKENRKEKKIKKVTGVRCHDKLENKLSQKEKIAKDTRFQSQ